MVVANADWNVIMGGDVSFLPVANMGTHVTEKDMGLLGWEDALVGELVEKFFGVKAAGGDIRHGQVEWVTPSEGGWSPCSGLVGGVAVIGEDFLPLHFD